MMKIYKRIIDNIKRDYNLKLDKWEEYTETTMIL